MKCNPNDTSIEKWQEFIEYEHSKFITGVDELEKYLLEHKFKNIILNANEIEDLVLYGAGNIPQELVRKTSFFKKFKKFA